MSSERVIDKTEVMKKFKQEKKKVGLTTNNNTNIKNKGTGAGGSNTNNNGISYEKLTDLDDRITIRETNKFAKIINFNGNEKLFTKTQQGNFFKYMDNKMNAEIKKAHGCKNPDECYIDEEFKNIVIIEKKFQQCSGSACEKIKTAYFKLGHYRKTFPDYNIIYIYCLSDWFKKNCPAELEHLMEIKIPYFWGSSETYKDDIIDFILNYK